MAIKKLKANGHIVQADWCQTDPKKMDYIHNKPEIPENIATEDFVEDKITEAITEVFVETQDPDFVYNPATKTWDRDPFKSYVLTKDMPGANAGGELEYYGQQTHNCFYRIGDIIRCELIAKFNDNNFVLKQTITHSDINLSHYRYFYSSNCRPEYQDSGWGGWMCTAAFPKPANEESPMNFVVGIGATSSQSSSNNEMFGGLALVHTPVSSFLNTFVSPIVEAGLSTKLTKSNATGLYRAYGINDKGEQTTWNIQSSLNTTGATGYIARYMSKESFGNTKPTYDTGTLITGDPNKPYHVANKNYVDTNLASKVNKAGGWTSGNYIAYKVYAAHSGGSEAMLGTAYMERIGQFTTLANQKFLFDDNLAAYQSKTFLKTNQNVFNNTDISAFSDSENGIGELLTGYPTTVGSATNKYYVDNNFIKTTAEAQTITGALTVTGDLTIKGTTKTQEAQTQLIEENIIELNSGKVLNETQLSGVVINKDNTSAYGIVYDPSSDAVKLGLGQTNNGEFSFNSNEGTPIATREEYKENWEDDAIFVFDKKTKKFKYSGKTLASFEEEIMTKMRSEMNTFVKDYVKNYMSYTEIEHEDGTIDTTSDILFAENYTEKQNGTELWIEEN